MKQIFSDKQERITYTKSRKALVCVNEKEVINEDKTVSYEYDTVMISTAQKTEKAVLEALKADLCSKIKAYDKSEFVNSFILGENKFWIEKNTRMSLRANVSDDIFNGKEVSVFWFNGVSFKIPCAIAKQMLIDLECYAKEAYDVTQQHYIEVSKIKALEGYFKYNYTVGYPSILNFKL